MKRDTDLIMAANPPCWSVAVFAYNEAQLIRGTLESIEAAAAGHPLEIIVLANGCKDATGNIVRDYAKGRAHIRLIEIELADKANAWNTYVHQALSSDRYAEIRVHFFVDGDMQIGYKAFSELAAALDKVPSANAAGGMPISGRDQQAWRVRMVSKGMLAGCFYALRGSFVERIRTQRIFMPVGFIGEDWLISYLANTNLGIVTLTTQAPLVVFSPTAGFSFRSLNPLYPSDYLAYLKRLWRYALRGVQFEMLFELLWRESLEAMPCDVEELYWRGIPPSRLKWVGRWSVFRLIAVQRIRIIRAHAIRNHH